MTAEELLAKLDEVRRSGRGWMARCPAHDDREPSLSVREGDDGRILVHCFAGCSVGDICAALGLAMRNLFPDSEPLPRSQREVHHKPRRFAWRRTAALLEDHALTLRLRAESVLASAKGMHTPESADGDFDLAMNAVSRAYTDIEQSEFLEDFAFHLRLQGLTKERENYAPRSRAA